MKRRTLIVVACVVGVAWFVLDRLGPLLRGTIGVTTTDPVDLGLVASASSRPISIRLGTSAVRDLDGKWTGRSNHITFTLPAAYVTENSISYDSRSEGYHRLGLTFWSRTMDPLMPDLLADRKDCPTDGKPCRQKPDGRVAVRQKSGEFKVNVVISNDFMTGRESARQIGSAFEALYTTWAVCEFGMDAKLGFMTARKPFDTWNAVGNYCADVPTGTLARYGTYYPGIRFLRRDAQDTPVLSGNCQSFGDPQSLCYFDAMFGHWSYGIWLPSRHAADWETAFTNARRVLTKYTTSRTD